MVIHRYAEGNKQGLLPKISNQQRPAILKPNAALFGKYKQSSLSQRGCNSPSFLPILLRGTRGFREHMMFKVNSGTETPGRRARLQATVFYHVEERFVTIKTG